MARPGDSRAEATPVGHAISILTLERLSVDVGVSEVRTEHLEDLEAEIPRDAERLAARTEGGRRVMISMRPERSPRLRDEAVAIHGVRCQVCSFDFGERYGDWGAGFVHVHHREPLGDTEIGERETDPRTDLAVLCANCHAMVHRRRGIVLELDELRAKLR